MASRPSYGLKTTGLRKTASSAKSSSIAEKSLDSAAWRKRSDCTGQPYRGGGLRPRATSRFPLHRPGREQVCPERPAEHLLSLRRSGDQLSQVDAGPDPHLLEHRDQVLGRDIPRRAGWHGAAAELAERALERADPLLERGEYVGESLTSRVVEVRGQLDRPKA